MDPHEQSEDETQRLLGMVVDGKYRIDHLIGEGGMGAVYRVHHLGLRRDLALKVLRPEITSHTDIAARFDREAQSLARLEHPNCLRATDYGTTDDGLKYMVMPLLDGHELTDLLDRPLPPERAIQLTLQIVRGLEHAHGHGIVHRDLKPENVFITTDHEGHELLKLVDFGIAKIDEDQPGEKTSPKLTRAGMVFGTPRYMSPEQAVGGTIDHRSDLYSLGVILYQMLAGTVPFASDDMMKVLRQQIVADPPPLPEHVPAPLRAIVDRLLAKEREERFPDATQLAFELEQLHSTSGSIAFDATIPPSSSVAIPIPVPASNSSLGTDPTRLPTILPSATTAPPIEPTADQPPSQFGTDPTRYPTSHPATTTAPPIDAPATDQLAAAGRTIPAGWTLSRVVDTLGVDRRPWWHTAGAGLGGLLALVLTCTWAFSDDPEAPGAAASESAWSDLWGGSDVASLDEDELQAIDDALVAGQLESAQTKLAAMEGEHPEHPYLKWRRGRLLVRKGQRRDALALYGTAAYRESTLLDDRDFFAELDALLREPKIQGLAVTVAIEQLGHAGHKFLLESLNGAEASLPWDERKRAMEAVQSHEECAELIDARHQVAVDLLQARQSKDPCETFGRTLAIMRVDLHQSYLQPAHDAKLPRKCKEHRSLLAEVRAALVQKHGRPKKSSKCKGLGGMFRSGC